MELYRQVYEVLLVSDLVLFYSHSLELHRSEPTASDSPISTQSMRRRESSHLGLSIRISMPAQPNSGIWQHQRGALFRQKEEGFDNVLLTWNRPLHCTMANGSLLVPACKWATSKTGLGF